ncbi:MAG: nucleoside transporter C-terminal domain-containing protein [Acidobacteriota bacterium]
MLERAVSFLGLLALLAIAWAFSKHRHAVRPRTVIWGMSLQLLFALIILGGPEVSRAGFFILVFLVVLYFADASWWPATGPGESSWRRLALVVASTLVGCGVVIAAAYATTPVGVAPVVLGIAVIVWLTGVALGRAQVARGGVAATALVGFGVLWAKGIGGRELFQNLAAGVSDFLGLANAGAVFMFGNLADPAHFESNDAMWPGFGFQFAFTVLPTIIFFSAFMAVLYQLGIVQVVVAAMARFMRWSLGTSGSETLSCSANVFVGQTEAPFLIKPFLNQMTLSELHAVMVGGFATIAGGVLAGYIGMGVDAGHLIAASVMSAPAALVIAKLLYPETEPSHTAGEVEMPPGETADNVVGAAAKGTEDGLKLALNVGAMLIAFIALIAVVDVLFAFADRWIDGALLGGALLAEGGHAGIVPHSLQAFFGWVLRPLAWIMGVPWHDADLIGYLLGVKLAASEFVAYGLLAVYIEQGQLEPRSAIIGTYALCGFANFASIGIQIGGIGALAPARRADLAKVAVRAMFGGALASFTTATVAGILL